jgi:hypothetical protein
VLACVLDYEEDEEGHLTCLHIIHDLMLKSHQVPVPYSVIPVSSVQPFISLPGLHYCDVVDRLGYGTEVKNR